MTRDEVFALIRPTWPTSSSSIPARITEEHALPEDLEADSLDLYTLVQELEDSYGVRIPDEQAAQILTRGPGARLRPGARAGDRRRPDL